MVQVETEAHVKADSTSFDRPDVRTCSSASTHARFLHSARLLPHPSKRTEAESRAACREGRREREGEGAAIRECAALVGVHALALHFVDVPLIN